MPRRTTDSEERDTKTEVLTQRKGQRPQSQHTHATMAMDLATFHPLPSPHGVDGKTSTTKKRSRNNTTTASDLNFNSNSNSNSKPRKPMTRPPAAHTPDPEGASDTRTQPREKIPSKLPIPSTSKSFKGKQELDTLIDDNKASDAASITAGAYSPNPRARKVQRLNGQPPISSIDFTSQRKKPSRTPKSTSSAATSVFMNLGGRRLSTPLRMSPPNIDLTASPRPASPGEDPILLVGSELDHARRSSRNKSSRRTGVPKYPRPSSSKLGEDGDSTMLSYEDSSTTAVKVEDDTASSEMDAFPSSGALVGTVPKEGLVSPVRRFVPPPVFHTNSPPRDNGGSSTNSSFAMDEDTADDSYSADDLGFIGPEFTIPIRQGSPSPPTLHRRSFTKLGQRKPTPRRLVLDGEGDVSMMAKTVYYEHGEDQVEPPSPSPTSRRRVKKATIVDQDEPFDEFGEDGAGLRSPSPYPRILDGLDTSREEEGAQADTSGDTGLDEKGFPEDLESDASGYIHDPTGFEVLKEFSPDPPPEGVDLPLTITTEENGASLVPEEQSFQDSSQGIPESPEPSTSSPVRVPTVSSHASPSGNNRRSESQPPAQDSIPSHSMTSPVMKSQSWQSDDERDDNGGYKEAPSQASTQQPTVPSQKVHLRGGEDTEDDDHLSYDFDDDSPVVEVSSTNPRAAARAAVILKMHHSYIVEDGDQSIPDGGPRASRSRRRSNAQDGSRSSRHAVSRSRSRDAGIGNTSTVSLPDLLQEAEQEVLNNSFIVHPPTPSKPSASLPKSPSLEKHPSEVSFPSSDPRRNQQLGIPAAWSKEDWKNLERCFIKQRKLCAQRFGVASSNDVDPSDVDIEAVVDRFQAFLGKSASLNLGPEWERDNLVLRAMALQKRLLKVIASKRFTTPASDNRPRPPETPSTFGDDYEYDRSSRQSSLRRSSSAQSLPLSLHAPQYAHLLEEARSMASSRIRNPQLGDRNRDSPYSVGASSTMRPSDAYGDPGGQSYERASSSGHSSHHSETSFKVPEMTQVRRDRPLSIVAPLRRASSAPMRDPEVSLSREYEELPDLRHLETPPRSLPPPTLIPLPPLNHVGTRSSTVPISIPSSTLRKVSSNSSVKDLVRGFEDLTEEIERKAVRSTPRSQSQGAEVSISRKRSGSGSTIGSSFWFRQDREIKRDDGNDEDVGNDTFREIERHVPSSSSSSALPKQRAIPPSAPPKKRMSFLNWRW